METKNKIPFLPVKGSGCIYYLVVLPFVLTINLCILIVTGGWLIFKWLWSIATATPERKRFTLLTGGGLLAVGFALSIFISALDAAGIINLATPEPTLDPVVVEQTALAAAWLPYTQTAAAMPTITETATTTPTETFTPLPSETSTLIPTATIYVVPVQPTQANCIAAYPGVCIQPGPRKSCDQLGYHNFTVLPPDPLGYDGDGDGVGCER